MVNRRERVRAATVQEIKDVARRQLVGDGPSAVSLRAIAREMGMTAPALYRYFPSFDHLVQSLVTDLSTELCAAVEHARDLASPDDAGARLLAVCRAFRAWSVGHPAEFGLIFGAPTPGYGTPAYGAGPSGLAPAQSRGSASESTTPVGEDAPAAERLDNGGARFGRLFLSAFAEVYRERRFPTPESDELPARLTEQLAAYRQRLGSSLPLGALAVVFGCWMRLYGLVSLEVFNHMSFALPDPEPFFEGELAEIAARLNITDVEPALH
jgi:AcrR family transcriptional regulator